MTARIEKFLIVILVLTIVGYLGSFLWPLLFARLFTAGEVGQISLFQKQLVVLFLVPKALVCLCVAFWLRRVARQYGAHPNGWFIFGLFLGLVALILFYVVRLHDMIEAQTTEKIET